MDFRVLPMTLVDHYIVIGHMTTLAVVVAIGMMIGVVNIMDLISE
jgi:hypothetical protein